MAVKFAEGVRPLLIPIEQVHQHPDNPNSGDIEALMDSIQINGFYTAVTADKDTGHILVGNHRYQALLGLGAKEIPVIWVDAGEEKSYRILVGDNILSRLARMDPMQTAAILRDLKETSDLGLAGTGTDEDAYEKLLLEIARTEKKLHFGGDKIPELATHFRIIVTFDDRGERDEALADMMDHFEGREGRVTTEEL